MLTTIKLYGHLGRRFGKIHRMVAKNPAQAVRILSANYPDFRAHLLENSLPGYHIRMDDQAISEDELHVSRTQPKVIKFIPIVAGSKSPWATVIIGAALIALTISTGGAGGGLMGAWLTGMGASAGTAALIVSAVSSIGVSMVIGGVSQLLAGTGRMDGVADTGAENKPSYSFDGAVNTTAQGYPVPVAYGMIETGSAVLSAGYYAEDFFGGLDNEPTTGFRITAPLLHVYYNSDLGAPNISEPITTASGTAPIVLSIVSQSVAGLFSISSGNLVATAVPDGEYTVDLRATDALAAVTNKTIIIEVANPEVGDPDHRPDIKVPV